MALIRKRKASGTSSTKKKTRTITKYTIDGINYKSKQLVELHSEWKKNKLIKSFKLPSIEDEKIYRNKKFGAKKCVVNGIEFDSIMEAKFYIFLLEQKKEKLIKDFDMQVPFVLMDKYKNKFTGKMVREIKYLADFVIDETDGSQTAIDVKGIETPEFKIKAKLFGSRYPDVQFMCVQWSDKYGKRWIELEELKALRKEDKKGKK